MDISSLTATQTQRPDTAVQQSEPVLTSDFETFLQMLTTQAKYQDPLEPIDSSEYAAQLAQFSMVEQQVKSNELLDALASQLGAGNIAEVAGWIGMEARSSAPAAFDGAPITVETKPAATADEAVLVAYDSNGDPVLSQQIPVSGGAIEWTGVRTDGSVLPNGAYTFSVESRFVGEVQETTPAESFSRIVEARREGNQAVLVLNGGETATTQSISALREAL